MLYGKFILLKITYVSWEIVVYLEGLLNWNFKDFIIVIVNCCDIWILNINLKNVFIFYWNFLVGFLFLCCEKIIEFVYA